MRKKSRKNGADRAVEAGACDPVCDETPSSAESRTEGRYPGRDAKGRIVNAEAAGFGLATRFKPNNTDSRIHGACSEKWLARPEIDEVLRANLARVLSDAGDPSAVAFTRESAARQFVRVDFLLDSMFHQLRATGGPFSSRGKTRALFSTLLATLDKHVALVRLLGLERKQRRVDFNRYLEERYGRQDAREARGEERVEDTNDRRSTDVQDTDSGNPREES